MSHHDSGRAFCSIECVALGCCTTIRSATPLDKDKAEDVSWGEMERGHEQERGAEIKVYSIKEQVGFVTILFGLIVALIGVFWMFGDYLGAQLAGIRIEFPSTVFIPLSG